METVVSTLHYIVCVFLILSILLQSGKGADIGAAFGAGGSQTLFGPRGTATLLSKVTIVVAILFLVTSIILAQYSHQSQESVLERVPLTQEEEAEIPPPPPPPAAETQNKKN